MAVNIATLNINGLRDVNKRMGFLHWLCHSAFDIVCLQEVHALSSDECSSWFQPFGFSSLTSPGSNHARETAVLYKSSFTLVGSFCDTDGRFASCNFSFRDKTFCVVSLYALNTNPDRDDFFSSVFSRVDPSVHTVLCSDFNTVVDRSMDRRGSCTFDYSRFSSLAKRWEIGKKKLKRIAIHFGSVKKRERESSRDLLWALASHLKIRIDEGLVSCFDAYKSTLLKLASLDQNEAEAAKVRSRVRWAEKGETSSTFFFRLEKKNGLSSWFSAIRADDGAIATDLDGISAAWFSFYSSLFSAEPTDPSVQNA